MHQTILSLECSRSGSLLTFWQPVQLMAAADLFPHCGLTPVNSQAHTQLSTRSLLPWDAEKTKGWWGDCGWRQRQFNRKSKSCVPKKSRKRNWFTASLAGRCPATLASECLVVAREVEDKCQSHKCPPFLLLPPTFITYHTVENSPLPSWVGCQAEGKQPTSPLVLNGPYGKAGPSIWNPESHLRCNHHLLSCMLPVQLPHCNLAIAALAAAKPALLNPMVCCDFGMVPAGLQAAVGKSDF